jgi:hypothetical protein
VRRGSYEAEKALTEGEDGAVSLSYGGARLRSIKTRHPLRAQALKDKVSVEVRFIKSSVDNAVETFFISNEMKTSACELKEAYRKRRSMERSYRTLKNKVKFESVTGKASIYVERDFFAQMLIYDMTEDFIAEAQIEASEKGKEKGLKYVVMINENIALCLFKERFI